MSVRQKCFSLAVVIALFALPLWGQTPIVAISDLPSPGVQQKLDKLFYRWDSYELDLPAVEREARQTGRLKLHVGGRLLDLDLELNDLRAPGFQSVRQTRRGPVVEKPSPIATFKGRLRDDPESVVRLLIRKDFLQGYIRTGDEWIFIDPLLKYAKGAHPSKVLVFDNADVRPTAGTLCGAGELAHRADDLLHLQPEEPAVLTGNALIPPPNVARADIATDADYEYYQKYSSNTNIQIEGIINQVEGIYWAQLSLTLRISYQSVWMTASDPYISTNAGTLLSEFRDYWNANQSGVVRDLAHLFTGRVMNSGIKGIASPSTVCSSQIKIYAITQDFPPHTVKVAAHEIGHNFSARHDSDFSPPTANCDGTGPIMCSPLQLNGPNIFSSQSKTDIANHVSTAGSCLDRLPWYTILTSQVPDTTMCGDGVFEVGNRFTSAQDGYIVALRFRKANGENGTHVGRLWTDNGAPLASVPFTNETPSGWQEQYLPTRVKITAGNYYFVTYNSNTCLAKTGCGLGTPITNGPLTATGGGYSNAGGGGTFLTNGSCSNFFADVYFIPK